MTPPRTCVEDEVHDAPVDERAQWGAHQTLHRPGVYPPTDERVAGHDVHGLHGSEHGGKIDDRGKGLRDYQPHSERQSLADAVFA